MKVILFGATGMVGRGVLRECLLAPEVEEVLSIGRTPTGQSHAKLREVSLPSLTELSSISDQLRGYDGCFFCLGVASAGLSEDAYSRVTYDLTVGVARTLVTQNPGMTFIYVSGAGTDSTERGRSMWARVKGRTENALLRMPFKAAYMFRPGLIRPLHGIKSKTRSYRILYTLLGPFLVVAGYVAPSSMTCTDRMGRAMIHAVARGAPKPILETRDINDLAG
jgi:uncharacterized protein YbjT (DUF2867 family)